MDLSTTDTTIGVANTTPFSTFEGISTSTGYVKIGQEIIFYDGIGIDSLSIGTRGIDNTPIDYHFINDRVFKYEFNGISLRKINKKHDIDVVVDRLVIKKELKENIGKPRVLFSCVFF